MKPTKYRYKHEVEIEKYSNAELDVMVKIKTPFDSSSVSLSCFERDYDPVLDEVKVSNSIPLENGWRTIDSSPKNAWILLWGIQTIPTQAYWTSLPDGRKGWSNEGVFYREGSFSHWMPLPSSPTTNKE